MNWGDVGFYVGGIFTGIVLSACFVVLNRLVDNIQNTVSSVHNLVIHVSEQQTGISNQIRESTKRLSDRIHSVETLVTAPAPEATPAPDVGADVGVENRTI